MNRTSPNPFLFMVLAGAALIVGGGLTYWQYSSLTKVSAHAAKLKKQVDGIEELRARLEHTQDSVDASAMELAHLESSLTTAEYIPTLLKDLEAVGTACNLKIIGVRPLPPQQVKSKSAEKEQKKVRKPYQEIDVEVKCAGSFDHLLVFLKKLEEFPKIVGVRYLTVSPKVSTDGLTLTQLESTVAIRVYVFAGKAAETESSEETTKNG
ncbi:MAG: hypothetical protein AKCLJLPJ_00593 [Fimbriimonadales bacterium]|nr:MAG: hypothetical protein EDM73_02925 [Armatimonadota bacterium]MBV6502546.1 hypothetical protein [Fimbriimonadales bacterium]MCE7898610.1 hypothetical protein [Armatimonadetes bacterium ATM1]MDL1928097.1 hypothetical protein [Fimbriimonadia bacterium ATM]MBC6968551.1 hypothetical protein [Armatimonadota bacterium]